MKKAYGQAAQFSIPNCSTPVEIFATNTSTTGATINWTETGSATQWEVLLLPVGSPEPASDTSGILTSSNPYTASGLIPGTVYKCYVRPVCAFGVGEWSYSIYVYPACTAPAMLNITNLTAFGANVAWTEMGSATQWEVIVQPASAQRQMRQLPVH
ncbi:fibronectin type III domain-containing protein [Flavobacterium sp. 3HN19-14]|uniref:fibronectin type III domain-containing protein n=1 Tax=Flavobacterium sp. 3HN19-14 TaxID=3448133 RepID=UPI003EE23788